jgi:hypothetical protein
MDPAARSLRGRLGAYSLHAKYDTLATTAAAREAIYRAFEDEVDPDRLLSDPERRRRAQAARTAHMLKLAYRSAQVRAAKRGAAAPPPVEAA